jgi:hypothetical protein
MKHNKKRNTAFLYECLVKELTKSIVRKENSKKNKIIATLKEYFSKDTLLHKDLSLYRSILENKHKMTNEFSRRFLFETKKDFENLDRKAVFNRQTKLIESINKSISNSIFKNFIPNYKNIATVGQWFASDSLNAKSRLLIETKVLQILVPKKVQIKEMKHIDNLTYNTFTKKFNETYNRALKENQKLLLTNYITSFSDNGLGLKIFMNEEIGRLKFTLKRAIQKNSHENNDKVKLVLEKLESFSKKPIDEKMVENIFYIQDLTEELENVD